MRTRSSVPIGTVVAGKYRIDAVLGAGGMGVVLAATHAQLRQRVAIKLLHPEGAARRGAVERFLREARVAMSLRGEHVVRILDVGTLDDGSPFIAMECLEGRDFGALLEAGGPLEPTVAVDYILQAIEAIAEAHVLGVVHRDLKPANLFLTKRVDGTPCVKVLDFGVSKIGATDAELDETASSSAGPRPVATTATVAALTGASTVIGSPRYMAPEQIESPADVDARADVWALGVILFELLAGAPPFVGRTLEEVRAKVMSTQPPPLQGVPPALESVVRRCLAKDPAGRPASAHALAEALAPLASGGAVIAARIGRIAGSGPTAGEASMTPDVVRKPRRSAASMALLGAAGIAALAGVAGWLASSGSRSVAAAASASSVPALPSVAPPAVAPVAAAPSSGPEPATTVPGPTGTSSFFGPRTGRKATAPAGAPAAVADAGAPPPSPPPDPLHLDAGFLFRGRK